MSRISKVSIKRYYIGKVWRREEPQRLRFREITQADVDIVGGRELFADAEAIATGAIAIESAGIDYTIEPYKHSSLCNFFVCHPVNVSFCHQLPFMILSASPKSSSCSSPLTRLLSFTLPAFSSASPIIIA